MKNNYVEFSSIAWKADGVSVIQGYNSYNLSRAVFININSMVVVETVTSSIAINKTHDDSIYSDYVLSTDGYLTKINLLENWRLYFISKIETHHYLSSKIISKSYKTNMSIVPVTISSKFINHIVVFYTSINISSCKLLIKITLYF